MTSPPPITPWPIPDASAPAIIFGGSFDPPTRAHVSVAADARDATDPAAWLVFIPAARSPHKDAGPNASNADRLDMLDAAIASLPRAVTWTDELDRATAGQPSYMAQTLERAHAVAPSTRLRLLIGADQAIAFHRWHEPRRIIELAEPIVLMREPAETEAELHKALRAAAFWSDDELASWRERISAVDVIDASATEARGLLASNTAIADTNESTSRLREVLDDRVLGIILERGLYQP